MVATLALLPSPLLGPSVWQPVAQILTKRGWSTLTCTVGTAVRTAQDVLESFLAALPPDQDLVLVPHSNAGAYIPILAMQRRVDGFVFVDAVLPPPSGRVPLAPPAFRAALHERADDAGLLPPWTSWWDEANAAVLFPDAEVRAQVEREQQQLPVSYFEGSLPAPHGWDERRAAYLAFGDTYATDRDEASQRGWLVSTLRPATHLHMLIDPDQTVTELVELIRRLGFGSSAP